MTSTRRQIRSGPAALAGALTALLALAVICAAAMTRGTGGFEYPLDDVYIHLAIAEQIRVGNYGINPGEAASAASSPLYPLLLTPFSGSGLQRWLPLAWNVLAVAAAGALFGVALARASLERLAIPFAVAAPVALNMYGVAYTGMENLAHGTASLMIVLGLWAFIETRKVGWLLASGVLLAPALRLEGLALALAASGLVAALGNRWGALVLAALALGPALGFAAFLAAQGLGPLPNSIVAKLASHPGTVEAPVIARVAGRLAGNLQILGGQFVGGLTLSLAILSIAVRRRAPEVGLFGLAIATAGLAHLMFGSIGWMDRYENYVVLSLAAAMALVLGLFSKAFKNGVLAVVMLSGLGVYLPEVVKSWVWNVAAMQLQHKQMARFAKDFVKAPVAVMDIGHVSWRNPDYVLDLWGLASPEALKARLDNATDGWVGRLARERDVRVVMIYEQKLTGAMDPAWVRLGRLRLESVPRALIGGFEVTFFATSSADVPALVSELKAWEQELPEGARFVHEGFDR